MHACPPCWGGGLEQDRLLALVPDPHVLEQSSHVDHSVQRPFIGQGFFMHFFVCLLGPEQYLPPYAGLGLLQ